ncbi:MAG: hypothetical protein KAU01_12530 [Candidatus Cloacimonetes bacterium]|nr:hypothetical protein [Candidatus Cloacimonadota bacterium]
MKKIKFLIMAIVMITVTNLFAQWETDVRLTFDDSTSFTSNHAKCIAAEGDTIHVVWRDGRDGNKEIYYKHSNDAGTNWGADTRLTDDPASSVRPSVAVSGSNVHVVWYDVRDGNAEIYYKCSIDAGVNWGTDTRLSEDTVHSVDPNITVSDSNLHVVWSDYPYENIYYKRSTNGGTTWDIDTVLTFDTAGSWNPSVAVSGSYVHIVWCDNRDGNPQTYYKRSADGGTTWGNDIRLTYESINTYNPYIAVSGLYVHVVWYDERNSDEEIYFKRSPDNGTNWGADIRLTDDPGWSWFPHIAVSGSNVHVVWYDDRDGNWEIYYKRSTDAGTTWGIDTRLTNDSGYSRLPTIETSGSYTHVVWSEDRDGNHEVYYKRNPTGNVGVEEPIVTISKVGTNINLKWDPVLCASYYNVYSSTDPYASFPSGWTLEPTGIHITTTTWNDPVSGVGNKKFYRVTAEN